MTRESRPIRERIRNRTLFREQMPMKGRELIGYLTLSALILLPAVFGLWQQGGYVRTRLDIEAHRKETIALRERYRLLRIERSTLESLSRISEESRAHGLVPREEARAHFYVVPAEGRPQSAGARAEVTPSQPGGPETEPRIQTAGGTPPL